MQKAAARQSVLTRRHPEVLAYNYALARTQASLARLLSDRGQWDEAGKPLGASAGRLEGVVKADVQARSPRMLQGRDYRDLARVLTRLGEDGRAAELRRKADALGPERGPPDHFGSRGRRGER